MTWTGERKALLPSDWRVVRLRVLHRDLWSCQLRLEVCVRNATEVDHIDERTDHREANLRAVCRPCHGRRTQRQATDSRMARARRPAEGPPGLIR